MTIWLNASFEMRFRLIGGLTVRFAASEDHADQALLLSPWPESLLAFEPVWWRLAEHTHLVAVDLPGFGHSQRSDSLLTPQAMGEFIIAVADAFGLEHPHVVASSIGAAVPLQVGGMIRDIIEVPDLDGFRRADPRQLVDAALSGISRYSLPEPVRDDYLAWTVWELMNSRAPISGLDSPSRAIAATWASWAVSSWLAWTRHLAFCLPLGNPARESAPRAT